MDNGGIGHFSKITSSNLKKLIETVLIQLVGHIICSDNGGTLSSDNVVIGHLSIVSSSMLKKPSRSYPSLRKLWFF